MIARIQIAVKTVFVRIITASPSSAPQTRIATRPDASRDTVFQERPARVPAKAMKPATYTGISAEPSAEAAPNPVDPVR